MDFQPEDYYRASLERIKQARDLYRRDGPLEFSANHHPVAYYLCGVAVECMLRAFVTRKSKAFDGRHDLLLLLDESGLLRSTQTAGLDDGSLERMKKEFGGAVQAVNRLWNNSLRYASESRMRSYLHEMGFDRGIKGDPLKENLRRLLEASSRIIDKGVHAVGSTELASKLEKILKEGFHPATVGLSTRDGLVAWVVSDRFESMDDVDRQEAVWQLLEKSLSSEERRAVSIVVALTARERAFHEAGSVS